MREREVTALHFYVCVPRREAELGPDEDMCWLAYFTPALFKGEHMHSRLEVGYLLIIMKGSQMWVCVVMLGVLGVGLCIELLL